MEIYLDANATTPVLPEVRAAAVAAMEDNFGNPSSVHVTGLKARALMDSVRATARRVLRVTDGHVLFLSGATEGIQTAVLSAMSALRDRPPHDGSGRGLVLFGATEHKAVPEAIRHWNAVLRLNMEVMAIPVDRSGRHDLAWLRAHAPRAGLVCTMAANNETGVVSDLDGIATALHGTDALWLVDGVQALGKVDLRLVERRIDYVPFSGHKLYAPKGTGLLYVREGAPITPLLAGGGQEESLRSGTENMPGIAALGAVLAMLDEGRVFKSAGVLNGHRDRLVRSLRDAFPGVVFNAPEALSLPTTLNFSVPGVSSKVLLDLFDAAGVRVSGGSACGSSMAQPSYVLEAMGLPAWQSASAVRLSFGLATETSVIDAACRRIHDCGDALRRSRLNGSSSSHSDARTRVTRHVVDGACCYVIADPLRQRCVVIDPIPALTDTLVQWLVHEHQTLAAVLSTGSHAEHAPSAKSLRAALPAERIEHRPVDDRGWPIGVDEIELGTQRLTPLAVVDSTRSSTAYVLRDAEGGCLAFVGDAVISSPLGRDDSAQSDASTVPASLRLLASSDGSAVLMLPAHDHDDRFACRPWLSGSRRHEDAPMTLTPAEVVALVARCPGSVLVDVREFYEQCLGESLDAGIASPPQRAPMSGLIDSLRGWIALPESTPLLFYCRSGNRSAVAASAVRRLGHARAFSVQGGLALWPGVGMPPLARPAGKVEPKVSGSEAMTT